MMTSASTRKGEMPTQAIFRLNTRHYFIVAIVVLCCLPERMALPIVQSGTDMETTTNSVTGQPQEQSGQPQEQSGQPQEQSGQPQEQSGQPQEQSGQPQEQPEQPQEQPKQPQEQPGQPQEQPVRRQKRSSTKRPCVRPSNVEDMFQELKATASNTAFLRPVVDDSSDFFPTNVSVLSESEFLSPSTSSDSATTEATICPSDEAALKLPEGYYPQTVTSVQCRSQCPQCESNPGFRCVPVCKKVRVQRPNGCRQGMQLYEEQHIPVPTSCTCANKPSPSCSSNIPVYDFPHVE